MWALISHGLSYETKKSWGWTVDSGQTGEKVPKQYMEWETMPRFRQPCVSTGEMKGGPAGLGCLGQHLWPAGHLSALSSYEDALVEAMYEELDDLVTRQEGLLGRPGGCLCLPSSDFWLLPPTGCTRLLSIRRLHSCPRLTEVAPSKWQDGLSQPSEPPASIYTAGSRPVPSQL